MRLNDGMISIIVPVYRTEAWLEKCVRSVLTQTDGDWELILVDDGSPDNAGALCDRLAGEDARIRVIHQENAGVSAARNRGLDEARGAFAVFLDSDDWVDADYLERLRAWQRNLSSAAMRWKTARAHLKLLRNRLQANCWSRGTS